MSKFDNVDLGTDKMMQRIVKRQQEHDAEVWNAAIEAAAKYLEEQIGHDAGIINLKK